MKKLIVNLLILLSFASFAQEKYQKAKIYYSSQNDFKQLSDLGLALDHGNHKKNVFFESIFSVKNINLIKQEGFKVEIIIDDVQKQYINQNNPSHKSYVSKKQKKNPSCSNNDISYVTPVNFNNGSMGGFLTYSEMLQELDDMKTAYPNLITTREDISTFTTFEGRKLQYVKISDNPTSNETASEEQVLYTAIHHAREPMSLQQTIFYMWYLLENYDTSTEIKAIVDNTELFFVPCINPDGYIYNEATNPNGGGLWRKNRRNNGGSFGVDNNRNYSYVKPNGTEVWNTQGTSGPNGETYAGANVFSEPENQAIRWLVEQNNFKIALNAHSYSNLLLLPYGYAENQPTPDESLFKSISEYMVQKNEYSNIMASELYAAAGGSDDFMYGVINKVGGGVRNKTFAMTPEIGKNFWPPASQINTICKDMLFLNISAAQIAGNAANIKDNSNFFIDTTSPSSSYTIKRIGLTNGDFTVSINPITSNIMSVGAPINHNGLELEEEQSNTIILNLNSSINPGDTVSYDLVVNNGFYDKKTRITRTFGSTTTILNESGNDTSTNWSTSSWGISTTEFNTPSSSITDSPTGNYSANSDNTISLLNSLDLTVANNATLSFYAKWSIEKDYDYVQIQVSTDSGSSWIPQCGNFTTIGSSNQSGASNEPLYDGKNNDWVLETIDLSDYLGNTILIRFLLHSDGAVQEDGFYFDDLKVTIINTGSLSTPDFMQNNFTIYPNPVKYKLNISTNALDYDYRLYTIHGQLIKENENNSESTVVEYSNLPNGIYILDIEHDKGFKKFKIIKE